MSQEFAEYKYNDQSDEAEAEAQNESVQTQRELFTLQRKIAELKRQLKNQTNVSINFSNLIYKFIIARYNNLFLYISSQKMWCRILINRNLHQRSHHQLLLQTNKK
jgi:hypothetical protein